MIPQEHNILIENNIMLKRILAYIKNKDTPNNYIKEFIMNVITNVLSNNTYNIK